MSEMTAGLDAPSLEFLTESNAIEGIHEIDYGRPENARPGRGHVGALMDTLARALAGDRVGVEELSAWQGLVTEEQLRFGHDIARASIGVLRSPKNPVDVQVANHVAPSYERVPELLGALVAEFNDRLDALGGPSAPSVVALVGDVLQSFEAIHPFVDGNGRTGRLLANYIALRCHHPLLVFRSADRQAFYAAHHSKRAMRCYIAGLFRETVFDRNGRRLERVLTGGSSDVYQHPEDDSKLVVEWHELLDAVDEWRAE